MKKLFSFSYALMLCGCAQHASISTVNPSQNTSLPLTKTVVLSWDSPQQRVQKLTTQEHNRRLKELRSKRDMIRAYYGSVDKAVVLMLKPSKNRTMIPWNRNLGTDLYYRANLKGGSSRLYLSCNAWYAANSSQKPMISVMLSPIIRKPEHDLEFGWYVNTGNPNLDKKLRDIVIEEAKKF